MTTAEKFLPAAIGTVAIVVTTIEGIFVLNKTRYKLHGKGSKFLHPYAPWNEEHQDKDGTTYRAYKVRRRV